MSFALLSILSEEPITGKISIDETKLFNAISHLPDFASEHKPALNSVFTEIVDENNIDSYLKLYIPLLRTKQFKDILEYKSNENKFLIENTEETKGNLQRLLASSVKKSFWQSGQSKIYNKIQLNYLEEKIKIHWLKNYF